MITWNKTNPYVLGITLGALCYLLAGCAASPSTQIFIDKSVYIENPQDEVDFSYETSSGVSSDAKFDGEISPDITATIPIP